MKVWRLEVGKGNEKLARLYQKIDCFSNYDLPTSCQCCGTHIGKPEQESSSQLISSQILKVWSREWSHFVLLLHNINLLIKNMHPYKQLAKSWDWLHVNSNAEGVTRVNGNLIVVSTGEYKKEYCWNERGTLCIISTFQQFWSILWNEKKN